MDESYSIDVVSLWTSEQSGYLIAKRVFDVVTAVLTLVVISPLLLLIAVAIKLDSPGPILYIQQRVKGMREAGSNDVIRPVPFDFYKFRTMRTGSEGLHKQYIAAYIAGSEEEMATINGGSKAADSYKLSHNPGVTRIGKFLRQWSFDELPQLFNVIKGDMSLVGPRPPITYEVAHYAERHIQRLGAPGGITGLWQTSGRAALTFEEMVALDLEYIRSRTVWMDIRILLKTVPAVLSREGAG